MQLTCQVLFIFYYIVTTLPSVFSGYHTNFLVSYAEGNQDSYVLHYNFSAQPKCVILDSIRYGNGMHNLIMLSPYFSATESSDIAHS